ncbi:dihydrodipicolinate synthase family protein [Ruminococcus sp. 5_1_39BFAA]|uniref:dihydrodipicolinate synthase family protein n=1 Tax=Ruminococcus sp. 5_1_39BFAA TaxID=457412 RepID=UPI0035694454
MRNLEKYKGIIPAFYACYGDDGAVNPKRTRDLTRYLIEKGVKGVYVGGSSGECIYQSKEERKTILENVMKEAQGKITVIAHVGCNNTADSAELAAHAESLGVDAIASIPPIYFHLPDYSIREYWNDISAAAPNTDFIIYNIPQLAGVALSVSLYKEMLKNPRVIGVKNSSMPVQDIQLFKDVKGPDSVVFNGPDEQFVAGRIMGADGGIGGTYAVMPELFLAANAAIEAGDFPKAQNIQYDIDRIIYAMCSCHGNLYSVMKEILRQNGVNPGEVRKPLTPITPADLPKVAQCKSMITQAIQTWT